MSKTEERARALVDEWALNEQGTLAGLARAIAAALDEKDMLHQGLQAKAARQLLDLQAERDELRKNYNKALDKIVELERRVAELEAQLNATKVARNMPVDHAWRKASHEQS